MAIIQISKIQQRSGNLVDLPQLDEAQLGWANDARRMFVGRGQPYDPENIEVLTSYSNISFSQIDGAGGSNINVTSNALQNGQLLTYVSATNTWENYTGNSSQIGNSKIQLGNVANIKMTGGSTGYVLQTDGLGNLSWTPKTTIVANITGLTNNPTGNIITMTVANTTPYTNGTEITVSGVNGVSNSNVNSTNFYVKLASNFPSTGNVTLYTDSGLTVTANGAGLTYTNSPNALAISTVGGTSTLVAAGANTNMQFNNGGTLTGSPYLTILNGNGLLTHTGPYFSVGNVYANSGAVVGSTLTGTLTTNAQPNITSTGTLASLSVTSNANIGNIGTAGLITATGNIRGGNLVTPGVLSATGNANVGNLNTAGNVIASQVTANSNGTGNNFRVGDDAFIGDINITNTLVIKGQQDGANGYVIFGNADTTSTLGRAGSGALTYNGAFSVTGNANIGNIGTAGLITATGNLNAGNIITAGLVSATGNGTFGNVSATLFTGNLSGTGNSNVGNLGATGVFSTTLSASGNANVGNIGGAAGVFATVAGSLTTAAQPNITSTGTLASLSVTANANIGNIGTAGLITATGNIGGGNINTAGVVSAGGNASVLGIKTDNYYYANGVAISFAGSYSNSNVSSYLPTYTGQVGTGTATHYGTTLTTGANTTAGTITGNWSLSAGSKLSSTYADLAEYYEADMQYEPGTVLAFGGEKEVTIAEDGTTRVAGVVSTNPAYAMNQCCKGFAVAIALQGRVPTKVRGTIRKGDLMVSAGNGYARPWNNPQMGTVIGKALENFDGVEGVIEVAVGRL